MRRPTVLSGRRRKLARRVSRAALLRSLLTGDITTLGYGWFRASGRCGILGIVFPAVAIETGVAVIPQQRVVTMMPD
ncbi:MAG: hypothetical protein KF861_20970 [Planctomycetaceae bacterium]|nr:hypothetical protein [Planctomycetaceae bacterium]